MAFIQNNIQFKVHNVPSLLDVSIEMHVVADFSSTSLHSAAIEKWTKYNFKIRGTPRESTGACLQSKTKLLVFHSISLFAHISSEYEFMVSIFFQCKFISSNDRFPQNRRVLNNKGKFKCDGKIIL